MAADVLAMQGARVLAAMTLTKLPRNIMVSETTG